MSQTRTVAHVVSALRKGASLIACDQTNFSAATIAALAPHGTKTNTLSTSTFTVGAENMTGKEILERAEVLEREYASISFDRAEVVTRSTRSDYDAALDDVLLEALRNAEYNAHNAWVTFLSQETSTVTA